MDPRNFILRAPEGEPGSGGGGDDPPEFTERQMTLLGQFVNSAITNRVPKLVAAAVGDGLKAINWEETLTPIVGKLAPQPKDDGGDGDDGKGKKRPASELETRLTQIAADLDKEKAARVAAEQRAQQIEEARKMDSARVQFRNALGDKLAPGMLDIALDRWTIVQNRLKLDENGTALLRVKKAPLKGLPEEDVELPLGEAIPFLLEEQESKHFIPAPRSQDPKNPGPRLPGGGAPPSYTTAATTDEEKARRALEREEYLRAKLGIKD